MGDFWPILVTALLGIIGTLVIIMLRSLGSKVDRFEQFFEVQDKDLRDDFEKLRDSLNKDYVRRDEWAPANARNEAGIARIEVMMGDMKLFFTNWMQRVEDMVRR